MANQMDQYLKTLDFVSQVSSPSSKFISDLPEIKSGRKGALAPTVRVGTVYSVRCRDNEDWYRTVLIRKNEYSNSYQALITNAVYGTPPFGMEEVSQESVFKRIRELNASTVGTSLDAFPFRGVAGRSEGHAGADLVSPLHKQQLRRN